jgi:hypothetical protein
LLDLVFGVMPAKAWPLWQLVQPPTMPTWFIFPPENPPGLVLAVVWQFSQGPLVGKWFTGLDLGVTPAKTWPLWQVVQPLEMPAWFITPG